MPDLLHPLMLWKMAVSPAGTETETHRQDPTVRNLTNAILLALLTAAPTAAGDATGGSFAEFDRRAKAGESLHVVFFGGSLTWGANATDQARTSYRALVAAMLGRRYPRAPIQCHDAAIGGTGSQLGVFRLERDVLSRNPDLVFLDFTANDGIDGADSETLASYEAIVRRLAVEARIPVVQVVFPFKWNIRRDRLPDMKRRAAHQAIATAYGCGWGDAVGLIIDEVEAGRADIDALWDTDAVHPGDAGYQLFAKAAWDGFEQAVDDGRVCRGSSSMLNPATYTVQKRVRLSVLGGLPDGWTATKPHLTSIYYDFQMSRWSDGLAMVSNRRSVKGVDGKPQREPQPVNPLRLSVQASTVVLFGEATVNSGHFRISVDGKILSGRPDQEKGSDRFISNRWKTGSGHLVIEVARGLDPSVPHAVEIIPAFDADRDEELRIDSICVAGGPAEVAVIAP